MKLLQADHQDSVAAVSRLIAQLGIGGLVALMAEVTEQQSDYFLLSGERQKMAQCMREFRILPRAAHALGHESRATH
jgi:hypothetical protein